MRNKPLPIYDICTLAGSPAAQGDLLTDHFGHYLDEHHDLHFPHKHSFYHLVYFTKGSGSHSIDFIKFPVNAGQLYFMIPGQVHTWDFNEKPEGYIVNFSAQYIHAFITNANYLSRFPFFSGIAAQQVIEIPVTGRDVLIRLFEMIIREYRSGEVAKDDMIRTSLIQLFILVSRYTEKEIHEQHTAHNSLIIKNFRQLINQHYKEKRLTKDYAAMLYVTPNYLNALSKDVTGSAAGELVRERVLLEAKRLLVNADMSIAQIAAELDFADNSYFSKFFKKYTGTTPEAFRKQLDSR